jgi:hypothetical protein
MMSATAEQQGGSSASHRVGMRLKLWLAVGLVFAAQVAILFWAGSPPPPKRLPLPRTPVFHIVGPGSRELIALQDPTFFVLPHRENFSGDAWLKITPREFSPTNWTESPRPLELSPQDLGAAFVTFIQTNVPPRFQPRIESGLDNSDAGTAPLPSISVPSRLRVEGDLARLRLLTPLYLPPQTNSDLLANTVVQLIVDANGNPFSSVLWAGCGKPEADLEALTNFAKKVRFAPPEAAALGAVPSDKMISGKLIFEWQTMPSNAPPVNP